MPSRRIRKAPAFSPRPIVGERLFSSLQQFQQKPILRKHPSDSPFLKCGGWERGFYYHCSRGSTLVQRFLQSVYFVAQVVEASSALQKALHGGTRPSRLHQFNRSAGRIAASNKRNLYGLQGIMDHLAIPGRTNRLCKTISKLLG